MQVHQSPILPVILSGGAGTRLWPLSREQNPKQLLPLLGERTLLRETLLRFTDAQLFQPPMIVTAESLRFAVAEEARQTGIPARVLLEPAGRNTAPALAAAALLCEPDTLLLAAASDHVITDQAAFLDRVRRAVPAARAGRLVTFAIQPTRPETGYGYIRVGEPIPTVPSVHDVAAFVEKPELERARRYVESGDYAWNSGMFLLRADVFLAELERLAPQVLDCVAQSVSLARDDGDFIRLEPQSFALSPAISIDHAVMEHTALAATIPCAMGWSDLGAWDELWSLCGKDGDGNVLQGEVLAEGASNCYLRSDHRLVAALGVENLVVVATDDAVLVMPRDKAQDMRKLVERMRREGRSELVHHNQVQRPWGSYTTIRDGERFQVKQLSVKPGAKLSLQKHYHRAEHWVVVNGTALVTRGEETRLLVENESIYIPAGTVHRLENPGKVQLNLIEVQSGPYLGEDDIVRMEDTYGRVV